VPVTLLQLSLHRLSTGSVLVCSPSLDVFSAPVADVSSRVPAIAPAEIASSFNNPLPATQGITSGVQVVSLPSDALSSPAHGFISVSGHGTVNSLRADPAPASELCYYYLIGYCTSH
jgi:hypothetical protein